MAKKFKVAVLGGTGMVGQQFISLLVDHPWFEVAVIAASERSAGKTYQEAVMGRRKISESTPTQVARLIVREASDVEKIAPEVDLVFSALDLNQDQIRELEVAYARREKPVISNCSAHRWTTDIPVVIPEINPEHLDVIPIQKKRLGTEYGFIVCKPNCSIQSYVPALHPLREFGLRSVLVATYQAISGAGKTFRDWPEMEDNIIPFIAGEDHKSEREPLKIWGTVQPDGIIISLEPKISAQCVRVPVSHGHLATVWVQFKTKPTFSQILERWNTFEGEPQRLNLPSAPKPFLQYFKDVARPQTKLDRELGGGMAIALGQLDEDGIFDYKFVGLSHNLKRGAAGGAILTAELLVAKKFIRAN